MTVEPFSVDVAEEALSDLKARIRNTRWPASAPGPRWEQGTDREYLKALLEYWVDDFDWRAQESHLNRFAQYQCTIDGVRIHFVHERARHGAGLPLILTHGWPGCFLEYLALVPLLTDPAAHGIEGPAFDLIIPSLPGYGFSERPDRSVTYRDVARIWHRLMRGLGYQRYAAGGSDFGSGVATLMALDDPDALIGVHLTNLELAPPSGPSSRPLSEAESAYLERAGRWSLTEGGYKAIQSTKPQTLAYALNDSPAGLAAWILEKWRAWSDSDGDLDARFPPDLLLTVVTLYWVTGTIGSSMRDYFDNRRWHGDVHLAPDDFVAVPTAIADFAGMFVSHGATPREWAERLYNVQRWTAMPRGGHFAALEEPELVARDIATFFSTTPTGSDIAF